MTACSPLWFIIYEIWLTFIWRVGGRLDCEIHQFHNWIWLTLMEVKELNVLSDNSMARHSEFSFQNEIDFASVCSVLTHLLRQLLCLLGLFLIFTAIYCTYDPPLWIWAGSSDRSWFKLAQRCKLSSPSFLSQL